MTEPSGSLVEEVEALLAGRIDDGSWPTGHRLPTVQELTISYRVSTAVIREALARLAARGRVITRQGLGSFVAGGARLSLTRDTPESHDAIADMLELRLAVEAEMAGLAAERRNAGDLEQLRTCLEAIDAANAAQDDTAAVICDRALHAAIAAAAHNPYFGRFLTVLGESAVPHRLARLATDPARDREVQRLAREHHAIVDAIAAGDPARARRAATRHLQRGLTDNRARLEVTGGLSQQGEE